MLGTFPAPDFWRAPTDTDRSMSWASNLVERHGIWRNFPEGVKVDWKYGTTKRDGAVVSMAFEKPKDMIDPPRIGTQFVLPGRFHKVEYFGRGPHENYWDRKEGAQVGRYTTTVEDLFVKEYVEPGENGYRTDIRWVAFRDEKGEGLLFCSMPDADQVRSRGQVKGQMDAGTISFSALRYSREELETLDHPYKMTPSNDIFVNIDLGQMGVGGDDGWGAETHDEFRFKGTKYSLQYRIVPLTAGDDPSEIARQ